MNRLTFALVAFLALPLLAADKLPNVVLIIGDDQGWTDYGFMGHKTIQTPNLDRLASQSAVFPQGYVPTSLCRASLACMMTGQYAHQHKICCNDQPEGMQRESMWGFLKAAPSFPRLLQEKGYLSFQTGKFWEGHFENGGFTHGMTVKGRHGDDGLVIGRKTMQPMYDFIQTATRAQKPFFLWYAPMLPHMPHNPPQPILQKYLDLKVDPNIAKYYAMCDWFDQTIGELLGWLDKNNLTDNTVVMYLHDNGWIQPTAQQKADGARGMPGAKNTPYDMGLRTPILVKWPGKIKPARYNDLVSSIDVAPTILQACGLPTPAAMSGQSFLDVATGAKEKLDRNVVYGELFVHTALDLNDPAKNLTSRWVRQGDFKLIVPGPQEKTDKTIKLFNLAQDPFEKTNLAEKDPAKVKQLQGLLDQWWKG